MPARAEQIALKLRARIMRGDDIAIGPGKADLLEAIVRTGSISAAAKQMAMSYRRAWQLVGTMNRCFVEPLVILAIGGKQGGGALLSPLGDTVLKDYRALQRALESAAESHAETIKRQLNPPVETSD